MTAAWVVATIINAAAAGALDVPMSAPVGDGCNTCSWTRYWSL